MYILLILEIKQLEKLTLFFTFKKLAKYIYIIIIISFISTTYKLDLQNLFYSH